MLSFSVHNQIEDNGTQLLSILLLSFVFHFRRDGDPKKYQQVANTLPGTFCRSELLSFSRRGPRCSFGVYLFHIGFTVKSCLD